MSIQSNFYSKELINLLEAHQVSTAIISPGSRNAPLINAVMASDKITTEVVIDERSAAFIALGFAIVSNSPVALICTSGSAMLNYAPAIAEAFYRKVPLIVITADRPEEWIDQDDSQTIRQPYSLNNYVWRSYNIPWVDNNSYRWYANRIFNEALLFSIKKSLPVHINIQIHNPSALPAEIPTEESRVINFISPESKLIVAEFRQLSTEIKSPTRIMVICGFFSPNKALNQALMKLSRLPNIVILSETIANLHGQNFVNSIDVTLNALPEKYEPYLPDVVITFGGAIVSRHIKAILRKHPPHEHWHIGNTDHLIDCFTAVTRQIDVSPTHFFQGLAAALQPYRSSSNYSEIWSILKDKANSILQSTIARAPWCDLKCFATLLPLIPRRWNVQFSNGTPIRYAQMFGDKQYHRCDCNRGVSGIDGCTSTAIGASLAYRSNVTLLITGDMSMQYDIGALGCNCITPRLKIVVIDNGGGAIFHFIDSTREMSVKDSVFSDPMMLPLKELSIAYKFAYYKADDCSSLRELFTLFAAESSRPAILHIVTSGKLSADILHKFYNHKR